MSKLKMFTLLFVLMLICEAMVLGSPENARIGAYSVSFDLGQINHSIDTDTYSPLFQGGEKYSLQILIPGEKQTKPYYINQDHNSVFSDANFLDARKNADLEVWIEDYNNISWKSWRPYYIKEIGTHSLVIDNLPGWILTQYHIPDWIINKIKHPNWDETHTNYTVRVRSEYRLEHRGTGESGVVEIDCDSDNSTLPYVMNFIKTIHVTKAIYTSIAQVTSQNYGFGNYTFDRQDKVRASIRKATDIIHLMGENELIDSVGYTKDDAQYTITSTGTTFKGYIDYTNDGYAVIMQPKTLSLTKGEFADILGTFYRTS